MSVHSMLFSPLRCCECVLYQVRPSPSTLPHPSFNTFGQCLAVILGQCLASTLHRFHVIAVLTEPLVLVGWFPRMPPGILNTENDNRQDDRGEHGGDDDGGGRHCVTLCVVLYAPIIVTYRRMSTPNLSKSGIFPKVIPCQKGLKSSNNGIFGVIVVSRCPVRSYIKSGRDFPKSLQDKHLRRSFFIKLQSSNNAIYAPPLYMPYRGLG